MVNNVDVITGNGSHGFWKQFGAYAAVVDALDLLLLWKAWRASVTDAVPYPSMESLQSLRAESLSPGSAAPADGRARSGRACGERGRYW